MKLDFITLYVIIFLNSVGFALIWAIISISYETLRRPAFYLFASLIMTCISGPLLVLGENQQLWTYAGNLLIISGFCLLWAAIRVFLKQPPLWYVQAGIICISLAAIISFGSDKPAMNIIVAICQSLPILMAIVSLVTTAQRRAGTWVAAAALSLFLIGHGAEATSNAMRLTGILSNAGYYQYAAWFLVCAILGISIANLGFLLMAVDQVKSDLHNQATRDELTNLPNRRALYERLPLIEKRARRLRRPVNVLMMDLNKFKAINDNLGHFAGDKALQHIAGIIQKKIDDNDFLARIGGDEFCILVPDADVTLATHLVEELRKTIADAPFEWRSKYYPMSATIGLTHWLPSSPYSLRNSLEEADNYLIKMKRNAENDDIDRVLSSTKIA